MIILDKMFFSFLFFFVSFYTVPFQRQPYFTDQKNVSYRYQGLMKKLCVLSLSGAAARAGYSAVVVTRKNVAAPSVASQALWTNT